MTRFRSALAMCLLAVALASCSPADPASPDRADPAGGNSLTGLVGETRDLADTVEQRTADLESMLP